MSQAGKAEQLRRLHEAPELLVLPNVWDAASATTVAAVPGCHALATASWAVAAALGIEDGGVIGSDRMVSAVGVVCSAVELPVSADLEDGYHDAGETVANAIAAGAVGCNLEDALVPTREHAARIAAARAAGRAAGVPIVINARTDVFLGDHPDVDEAIARGVAYLEAGADCVFVPGAKAPADLLAMSHAFEGNLSVLAGPGWPPLSELAELGVARVTFGPGLMGVAYAALRATAATLLAGAAPPDAMAFRPSV